MVLGYHSQLGYHNCGGFEGLPRPRGSPHESTSGAAVEKALGRGSADPARPHLLCAARRTPRDADSRARAQGLSSWAMPPWAKEGSSSSARLHCWLPLSVTAMAVAHECCPFCRQYIIAMSCEPLRRDHRCPARRGTMGSVMPESASRSGPCSEMVRSRPA